MDIEQHKKEFDKIIAKYHLFDEEKAEEIAHFLTTHKAGKVSSKEFANLFAMKEDEANIFLKFIEKGLDFKKQHVD